MSKHDLKRRLASYCQIEFLNIPWCGHALPQIGLDELIAPDSERTRLLNLAEQATDPEQCLAVLGEPEYNEWFPDEMGKPTNTRNIEYYNISRWYVLVFYFTDEERSFYMYPKWIPISE